MERAREIECGIPKAMVWLLRRGTGWMVWCRVWGLRWEEDLV